MTNRKYTKEFVHYVESLSIFDEYALTFGKKLGVGKVFCPFHHNVDTPAAKVYSNRIKCFSCNRSYSTFDLLRTFNPERLDFLSKSSSIIPTYDFDIKKPLSIPSISELDTSKGVTVELLDFIVNYGND